MWAREQWWSHEAGCEFLAANPVEIPGLLGAINALKAYGKHVNLSATAFPYPPSYSIAEKDPSDSNDTPNTITDPFIKLPEEIRLMIIDYIPSKDIANLISASRVFSRIPMIVFRRLVLQDMPWLWEANDLPLIKMNWYDFYKHAKFYWPNFKGMQNRKRIWRHVEEIVRRIKPFMAESDEM